MHGKLKETLNQTCGVLAIGCQLQCGSITTVAEMTGAGTTLFCGTDSRHGIFIPLLDLRYHANENTRYCKRV